MTKKKAIDRTLRALPLSNHSFYREVLENLWTEARIVGLREGAMMAGICQTHGNWKDQAVRSERHIRQWANTLAKKARAK